MKKLLIATTNPGKFAEYKKIFKKFKIHPKLIFLKDLNISKKVKENGKTFKENAVKKANFYRKLTGLPTLSDDAGIEIDYLGGEPGVKTRRWPGHEASDEELINFTLKKLKGVPKNKRGARFRAAVGLSFPGIKKTYTFEGVLRGIIAEKPIKKRIKGYPFRSIFIVPGIKKYLGDMNLVAHRETAIKKAMPLIKERLI